MEPQEFTPEWFDYCSKMWLQNKKRVGQGYEYCCKKEKCKNKLYKNTEFCYWHHSDGQKKEGVRKSMRLIEAAERPWNK
jgi:hypothetical protein